MASNGGVRRARDGDGDGDEWGWVEGGMNRIGTSEEGRGWGERVSESGWVDDERGLLR